MSAQLPRSSRFDIEVMPHRLCSFCQSFVRQANCLSMTAEELSPGSYDRETDPNPVVNICKTYPSLQHIDKAGREGCHLCSIMSSLIDEDVQKTEQDAKLRTSAYDNWIYTKLTLHPHYYCSIACFDLTLHYGYPYIEDDYRGRQITSEGLLIRSLDKDMTSDCKACKKCIIVSYPQFKKSWDDAAEHAHCRWTKNIASTSNVNMIRSWLDQCMDFHTECGSRKVSSRPTRILDLRNFEEGHIRLAAGTVIGESRYATLSYSWGGCNDFILSRSNLVDFEKVIVVEALPKTFWDAMFICRKLGFDFLWIDALCIIQGNDGDFKDEAARMEAVYSGSGLTIAAASAKNSNEGFLGLRNPLRQQDCQLLMNDLCTVLAEPTKGCSLPNNYPGDCALDSRGWVFQERLLSPRTLYFGSDCVHWECCGGVLCENKLFYDKHHRSNPDPIIAKHICLELENLPSGSLGRYGKNVEKFRKSWQQVIEGYSKTHLTYQTDKLVALAGIAGLVQRHLNLQASFGLWLDFFDTELMWIINDGSWKPIDWHQNLAIAPSWSWASIEGAKICNELLRLNESLRSRDTITAKVLKHPDATPFSHIVYDRQHGIGSKYAITIEGKLYQCRAVAYHSKKDAPLNYLYPYSEGDDYKNKGDTFYADFHISSNDQLPLYCLHVARLRVEDSVDGDLLIELGIVLTPINLSESLFRRVGFLRESTRSRSGPKIFKDYYLTPSSIVHII